MRDNDSRPFYIFEMGKATSVTMAFMAFFFLVITLLQIIYPATLDSGGILEYIVGVSVTSFLSAFLVYILVFRRNRIRVEFYDSFVRLFPAWQKRGIDVKYSDLKVTWRAEGAFTVGILALKDDFVGDSGRQKRQKTWRVTDLNGKNMDKPLFIWLQSKIDTD